MLSEGDEAACDGAIVWCEERRRGVTSECGEGGTELRSGMMAMLWFGEGKNERADFVELGRGRCTSMGAFIPTSSL